MLLGDRCTRRCGYCSVSTAQPAAARPRRARAGGRGRGPAWACATSCSRRSTATTCATAAPRTSPRPCAPCARALPGAGGRGADPRLQGRPRGARRRARRRARGLQPQHRDGAAPLPAAAAAGPLRGAASTCCARPGELRPGQATKSGLMVGLGETDDEVARRARRPARGGRRHRHDRPVPAADARARAGAPLRARPRPSGRFEDDGAGDRLPDRLLGRLRALLLQRGRGLPRAGAPR